MSGTTVVPIYSGSAHPDSEEDGDFNPPADATLADALATFRREAASPTASTPLPRSTTSNERSAACTASAGSSSISSRNTHATAARPISSAKPSMA